MNDQGLLLIHKFAFGTKITPQNFEAVKLANTLFEDCLDKGEKKLLWELLVEQKPLSNSPIEVGEITIKLREERNGKVI